MINNKQVNVWRGDQEPPTLFHVWIYNNEKILLYNGKEWVVFVDDVEITDKINNLQNQINFIKDNVDNLIDSTINNKLIKDNPVLTGLDLSLNITGEFINPKESVSNNIALLNNMFVTQIIG